jgi:small subunit ribosomal protein S20
MNKKERNRKLVKQNRRNRIFNRRYISTIKTLFKLFKNKLDDNLTTKSLDFNILVNNLISFIDKAVKKKVLHKNNAARKKSTISKLLKITKK